MPVIPVYSAARELMSQYDVVFCDIWGVVHDGVTAYEAGCEALTHFRDAGGTVVLVSNAPCTAAMLVDVLAEKNVPADCWDAIVPSGDLALAHISKQNFTEVHHLGPARNNRLFDNVSFSRVAMNQAEVLLCTGLINERTEEPEQYRTHLEQALADDLPLVCANPDLVVDVGGVLIPCAGSIARLYEDIGGSVYWAGKPFTTAYEAAHRQAQALRGDPVQKSRILAIGDAVRTDIAGASAYGIDALFIGQGIHRDVVMPDGTIEPAALGELFSGDAPQAVAAMTGLAW